MATDGSFCKGAESFRILKSFRLLFLTQKIEWKLSTEARLVMVTNRLKRERKSLSWTSPRRAHQEKKQQSKEMKLFLLDLKD